MSNKTPQEEALPYWPSKEFMDKSKKLLRENGLDESDEYLTDQILKAYRKKRAEVLVDKKMQEYEEA